VLENRKIVFPTKSTTCEEPVYHLMEKQRLIDQALKHKSYVNPVKILKYAVDLESKLSTANSMNQELKTLLNETQMKLNEVRAELKEKVMENEKLIVELKSAKTEIEKLKNKIESLKSSSENKI
jgi:peptidoglycan hydrolase CwlO-like protein